MEVAGLTPMEIIFFWFAKPFFLHGTLFFYFAWHSSMHALASMNLALRARWVCPACERAALTRAVRACWRQTRDAAQIIMVKLSSHMRAARRMQGQMRPYWSMRLGNVKLCGFLSPAQDVKNNGYGVPRPLSSLNKVISSSVGLEMMIIRLLLRIRMQQVCNVIWRSCS